MTTTALTPADEFEGFYQANFSGTVLLVYSFTADMAAAQDVVQEAFARAWQRWHTVSGYDDPLAWVRRVSLNLTNSRWRRLKTARAYLDRQREEYAAEASPDHVMVVAALRRLPRNQREALVLHYLADMPVEDVARHLDAPLGTVKSWLHRGRDALAGVLAIEVPAIAAPATRDIVERGHARRRMRLATVTAAAVLLVAFVLAVTTYLRPTAAPVPLSPTPSPTVPLPQGCEPGQVPVDLTLPSSEREVVVNVLTGTSGIAADDIAAELRNRRLDVGTVGSDAGTHANVVAVIRYGPEGVSSAHFVQAYLTDGKVTLEFDPDRPARAVDLVVGGKFKQFATPTEMRRRIATMGQPTPPPGTCRAAEPAVP